MNRKPAKSVFVVGITGKRLMPTTPREARKRLESGKAIVYCKRPFTIQMLYKTGATTQPVTLGVDTGSQHIGIAVVSEGKVFSKSDIGLRDSMGKRSLMETRKSYRGGRRYRKTRYRHPKFKFHTKRAYSEKLVKRKSTKNMTHWKKIPPKVETTHHKGWLPPSLESKLMHHVNWIERYLDVLPEGTKLRIELARFDIQRMKDPTIHNELYQQGTQYDYENKKAYVFARDNYTCLCCKKKAGTIRKEDGTTVKLIMHHIDLRSKGASDNPSRLATVCDKCHTDENHKPGGVLYDWYVKGKTISRGYRDATCMNVVCNRLREMYLTASFTYGNITTADRKRLILPKSHANDAVAIAAGNIPFVVDCDTAIYYRQVRKKKRSLHEANPRKGCKKEGLNYTAKRRSKNMKQSKGFFLWDKVRFAGYVGWISGYASDGYDARMIGKNGKYILNKGGKDSTWSISSLHKVTHNNNWICFANPCNSSPT